MRRLTRCGAGREEELSSRSCSWTVCRGPYCGEERLVPEWPVGGRLDDQRLVEAARRAEERAGDGLYDVYADRLTDFAYSLAQEMDAAADAVHAAIVTAHGRADLLRETSRLRAWLYALTRFHVYERVGRTPAHGFTAGQAHEHDHDVADPELTGVVREALAEMGQREREVLLLAVRHGLTTAEIGVVLGLSSRQAGNRLARAKEQLDVAGAGVILARTGERTVRICRRWWTPWRGRFRRRCGGG